MGNQWEPLQFKAISKTFKKQGVKNYNHPKNPLIL